MKPESSNHSEQIGKSLHTKFLEKFVPVTESGCWLWTDCLSHGYAAMSHMNMPVNVIRHSYSHYNGEIPEGHVIRHKCNVTSCVNPEHLETGTVQDNSNDMIKAGTSTYGEKNPQAKLNETEVLSIKRLIAKGLKYKDIAERFGVTVGTICNIKTGLSWGYLND